MVSDPDVFCSFDAAAYGYVITTVFFFVVVILALRHHWDGLVSVFWVYLVCPALQLGSSYALAAHLFFNMFGHNLPWNPNLFPGALLAANIFILALFATLFLGLLGWPILVLSRLTEGESAGPSVSGPPVYTPPVPPVQQPPISQPPVLLPIPPVVVPKPVPPPIIDENYLRTLCRSLLPLFQDIPCPHVYIRPTEYFSKSVLAWCRLSRRNTDQPCTIEFDADYTSDASEVSILNTMKHELIHAWMCFQGITEPNDHGHVFIMKAREVGCDVGRYERELEDSRRRPAQALKRLRS
jgi:hypothetical protein